MACWPPHLLIFSLGTCPPSFFYMCITIWLFNDEKKEEREEGGKGENMCGGLPTLSYLLAGRGHVELLPSHLASLCQRKNNINTIRHLPGLPCQAEQPTRYTPWAPLTTIFWFKHSVQPFLPAEAFFLVPTFRRRALEHKWHQKRQNITHKYHLCRAARRALTLPHLPHLLPATLSMPHYRFCTVHRYRRIIVGRIACLEPLRYSRR